MADALRDGDRGELRRRRRSRSRAPCSPSPGPRPRRPRGGRRRRTPAPATCSPPRPPAAREALARTPEQLQVLRDAGVVDAGGRGLSVILDAAETVLTGRRPVPVTAPLGSRQIPVPQPPATRRPDARTDPSYEVMYLLDAEDDAIPALREPLAGLGDSLVVVGGEGLWNVHVHVDDVGAAIEAGHRRRPAAPGPGHPLRRAGRRGARSGRPTAHGPPGRRGRRRPGPGRAVRGGRRASSSRGGPGRRPSTGQLLEAITALRRRRGGRAAQRRRLGAGRRDRRAHRRGRPRGRDPGRRHPDPRAGAGPGRDRRPRARPRLRPGRPRDDRDRPARPPGRGHGRGPAGDDDGRAVRARRRARRGRGRLRGRRRGPVRASPTDVLDRLLGGGGELVTIVGRRRRRRGRAGHPVRGVRRGAPPRCRRRGVRRRPGALPAARCPSSDARRQRR